MPLSRIGLSQNQQITGNVAFQGTGNRITGDMSNATIANRVAFQTSTANGSTTIMALPNGSGIASQLLVRTSNTATDDQFGQFVIVKDSELRIATSNTGIGTPIPMALWTSGTERINISTSGVVSLTSGQLKFPATQVASADPNTLDDYEEGTWTPTNSLGITTSTSTAHYVKIGLTVYLALFLNINSNSNGGSFIITGLPFALGDGSASVGCFNNTGTPLYAYMDSNGIYIRDSSNNSRSGGGLSGNFVAFQMTYRTAS
jgi:hypothetical protein